MNLFHTFFSTILSPWIWSEELSSEDRITIEIERINTSLTECINTPYKQNLAWFFMAKRIHMGSSRCGVLQRLGEDGGIRELLSDSAIDESDVYLEQNTIVRRDGATYAVRHNTCELGIDRMLDEAERGRENGEGEVDVEVEQDEGVEVNRVFSKAHVRQGQIERRVEKGKASKFVRAVVAELRTELPLKVTPRTAENYSVVYRKASTILKAKHSLRSVDAATLLPLIANLFFVPTRDDIDADDFYRSLEVAQRFDEANAELYDSPWLYWWPFSMFRRKAINSPLTR